MNKKHKFKIIRKYMMFVKKNLFYFKVLVFIVFLCPIGIIIMYLIFDKIFNDIIAISDLFTFYGSSLGMFVSIITYMKETKRKEKEKLDDLKPRLMVTCFKSIYDNNIFDIKISNNGKNYLKYVYVYDECVLQLLRSKSEKVIHCSFCQTIEKARQLGVDYNFTLDEDIIDDDGFPKYIQVLCDDMDNNTWDCGFDKIKNGNSAIYYPETFQNNQGVFS